ncbi:hypothetical protein [Cohnella rhizosphaerae]|uniref:Uncharacterized protein n=1 Tax=Cohnella rhizosphaerae TaxID=1457232 RepID=A0A9X4L514_9BACL|nr:hypothetical protein [Cohnella rhizosphaerae]MDG0813969.1 hypothetical protein [Cohnella rhizosphaerae]
MSKRLIGLKKLYDEKLMNSDFAITKDGSPNINQGKAGGQVRRR